VFDPRFVLKRVLVAVDRAAGTDLADGVSVGRAVAATVGMDIPTRVWVLAATLLMSTHRWRRPLRLRIRGPLGPMSFTVPDYAAIQVLREVFVYREYDLELPRRPRAILDLGSHVGASILHFALRYPGVPIVGLEPNPALFPILSRNVRDLPGVTVHQAAVTPDGRPATFAEATTSWAGSTASADGVIRTFDVPGLALDDLLARYNADVVKMDVEGAEFAVLPASRRLQSLLAVVGELHAKPESHEVAEVLRLFDGFVVTSTPEHDDWQPFTLFAAVRNG
jgi:FkbM family methyltransferase